jgi:hypothetical protein
MFVAPASNEFSSSSFKAIAGLKITYLTILKHNTSDIVIFKFRTIQTSIDYQQVAYKPKS